MAALIGPSRTKLILMGGQKILADEALSFGLVDRLIDGDVVEAAREIAADTLAAKPEIARGIKALCQSPDRARW
jgi:enoyl-CoA hydratase/carnithine racemase